MRLAPGATNPLPINPQTTAAHRSIPLAPPRGVQPMTEGAAPTPLRDKLRKVCNEMQATFLREMFKVMRESTNAEDDPAQSTGGDMFTSMLDDRIASVAAGREKNGLSDALYRQMVKRLPPEVPNADD